MEMEFLFKFNKEQFMMVPGQMTKNTDRELKNGSLEKYLMLVISKTVKKQEKEFWVLMEVNMKEILWMESFKDRESISISRSKELWKVLLKKEDLLVEKHFSKTVLFTKEITWMINYKGKESLDIQMVMFILEHFWKIKNIILVSFYSYFNLFLFHRYTFWHDK